MGFVRKHTGLDLTGGGASDAAGHAARLAEGQLRGGLADLKAGLQPFQDVGTQAAKGLMASIFDPNSYTAQTALNDPFYKALAGQMTNDVLSERAALGLSGSGATTDALTKNILLLGEQFKNARMNENNLRFNQMFNTASMGQNAAAMTGTNTLNTMGEIGSFMGVPGMLKAQEKAKQGSQFMGLLGAGAMMFGGGLGGGAVAPGMAGGGVAGGGLGSLGGALGAGMMPGMGGAGAMAGGLTSGIQGALMAGAMSDRALKRDIQKVGRDRYGNIYTFRYRHDPEARIFRGRMAQELREIRPDAVEMHESGYLKVSPEFMAVEVK